MERMPYREELDVQILRSAVHEQVISSDWRTGLPVLTSGSVVLRDLRASDAPSLFTLLTTEEVARFISPPPTTVEGFERFIAWTHRQRAAGEYVCFAVVPLNADTPVGLFQVRSLERGFGSAEWGFALASDYWGTGMFVDGARLTLDFVFAAIGARRLEARAAVQNGRGTAALRKVGAVHECELRRSFLRNGQYYDQGLWTILVEEWHESKAWRTRVI